MKKFTPVIAFLLLMTFTLPQLVSAAGFNLIVCDGRSTDKCDISDVITLFKNLITALVQVATVLTVIALIFMGIKLMTSGGNSAAMTEVKSRAMSIVKGYVLILAAWLIIYTILNVLVNKEYILLSP